MSTPIQPLAVHPFQNVSDFFMCGLGMINFYLGYLVCAETCEDDEWGALSE